MTTFHRSAAVGAVAAAALVAPAVASAHPSVWETTALVNCTATPNPPTSPADVTCDTQRRYVFNNHGTPFVLRESNGKTTGGGIDYQRAPTLLRNAPGFNVFTSEAATGAQPHATCDVPALTGPATIRSWQGTDPFFAYVPFQQGAAGVDDSATSWLPVVQAATGLNLETVADTDAAREAACEALPGATASSYVPADATQTTFVAFASHTIQEAVAPLQEEIAAKDAQLSALNAGATVGAPQPNAGATDGTPQVSALQSEIAALKLDLRNLKLALPATIPSRGTLNKNGIALTLEGPAKRTVRVRLMITAVKAKQLGLRSRILGSQSVALDAAGSAAFTLKPTSKAVGGLRKVKGTLEIAVDAATGDRFNVVRARLGG